MIHHTETADSARPANQGLGQLRRSGIVREIGRLGKRLFARPVLSQGYILSYPLDRQTDMPAPLDGLSVREIQPDDHEALEQLVRVYGVPMTFDRARGRLLRGKRCFTAWLDGEIVSYVWVGMDVIRVEGLFFDEPLKPNEMYLYDAHTRQEFRGQCIYPYLKSIATHRLANETGRTQVLSVIRLENRSSLRASAKLGGHPVLRKGILSIFGLRIPYQIKYKRPKEMKHNSSRI